jgi:hypothetical protein
MTYESKASLLFFVLLAMMVSSCHRELARYRSALDLAYRTNDLTAAEEVFLNDLQRVNDWERNHVKNMDYSGCRALDHEGLFYTYRRAHQTNKMELEFNQAIACMNQSRSNSGLPPMPAVTMDEFARDLEFRERLDGTNAGGILKEE